MFFPICSLCKSMEWVNWVICPSDRLCPVSMPLYPPPHGDSLTISHLPLDVEITHDSLSCLTPGSVPADTCWFPASPPDCLQASTLCLFTKIFVYHMVHSQHQFTECLKCRQDEGAHQGGSIQVLTVPKYFCYHGILWHDRRWGWTSQVAQQIWELWRKEEDPSSYEGN